MMRTVKILLLALGLAMLALSGCSDPKLQRSTVGANNGTSGSENPDDEDLSAQEIYDRLYEEMNGENSAANNGQPLVGDWVHVLDEDVMASLVEVNEDSIVFTLGPPELEEVEIQDILISGVPTPSFLRRVIDISQDAGTITFFTIGATLDEALLEGDVEHGD